MSFKNFLISNATNREVALEVYEQITVCNDLCKPLSMHKIEELLRLDTPAQVVTALHDYKFA